jgi:hypothetical protein
MRSEVIEVKLTDNEKTHLINEAKSHGYKSVSEYIRMSMLTRRNPISYTTQVIDGGGQINMNTSIGETYQ